MGFAVGQTLSDEDLPQSSGKKPFQRSNRLALQRHAQLNRFVALRHEQIAAAVMHYFAPQSSPGPAHLSLDLLGLVQRKAAFYLNWWQAAFETSREDVLEHLLHDMCTAAAKTLTQAAATPAENVARDQQHRGCGGNPEVSNDSLLLADAREQNAGKRVVSVAVRQKQRHGPPATPAVRIPPETGLTETAQRSVVHDIAARKAPSATNRQPVFLADSDDDEDEEFDLGLVTGAQSHMVIVSA